jgi:hypothetical protein
MIYKGCPRCQGDMFPEEELGGRDLVCLQCGHRMAESNRQLNPHAGDAAAVRWLRAPRVAQSA